MDPQPNGTQGNTQPVPPNGVVVDLLHPQEIPTAPLESAPVPPPLHVSPITPAPTVSSIAPAVTLPPSLPPTPTPLPPPTPVQQIGTTQQPDLRNSPSKSKLIAIIAGIILLLGAGIAAYFLLLKKPNPTATVIHTSLKPDVVSNLSQAMGDAILAPGAVSTESKVTFSFDFVTKADSGSLIPEVEVQPIDTHFTDKPTISGAAVTATGRTLRLSVLSDTLKNGSYHWQARIRIGENNGPWKALGSAPMDFGVANGAASALAAPVVETVGGVKVVGGTAKVSSPKPVFTGTSVAGAAITVTIKPEGIVLIANSDNSGAWSITPTSDIPNGDHPTTVSAKTSDSQTASINLILSVKTTPIAATPAPSASPVAAETPPPSPTPTTTLAPTGDPVVPISLIAFVAFAASIFGLWSVSRRHED